MPEMIDATEIAQEAAERVIDLELSTWDTRRLRPVEKDAEGWHYYVTDGCREVLITVPDDGKFRGFLAERYSYRVGKFDQPSENDPVYTDRNRADVEAEDRSDGKEGVWAVWDITDLYPRVVALAHYGTLYVKEVRR